MRLKRILLLLEKKTALKKKEKVIKIAPMNVVIGPKI